MDRARRLDLGSLLTRAEAAAPVGVVDAVAAGLLEMLDAHDVSFLIADFSGRSLNRLGLGRLRQRPALNHHPLAQPVPPIQAERRVSVQLHPVSSLGPSRLTALSLQGGPDEHLLRDYT